MIVLQTLNLFKLINKTMSYIEGEIARLSKQKTKIRSTQDYYEMVDARIITKNLVYVIGLSSRVANKDLLQSREYFGQYGLITKTVVNKNKAYNADNPKGPSYSAYITYSKPHEASIAILALDNVIIDDHLIRASFGTTKY
jgi:CCR4-NOT transcription complex subunit 4